MPDQIPFQYHTTEQATIPYESIEKASGRDIIRKNADTKYGRQSFFVPYNNIRLREGFNLRRRRPGETQEEYEIRLEIPQLADALLEGNETAELIKGDYVEDASLFLVNDGHRRFMAIGYNLRRGITEYPNGQAMDMVETWPNPANFTDLDRLKQMFHTNDNLKYGPMEVAWGVRRMKDDHGLTHDEIAKIRRQSRQWVDNQIILTNLDDETQLAIELGTINPTTALAQYRQARKEEKEEKKQKPEQQPELGEGGNPNPPEELYSDETMFSELSNLYLTDPKWFAEMARENMGIDLERQKELLYQYNTSRSPEETGFLPDIADYAVAFTEFMDEILRPKQGAAYTISTLPFRIRHDWTAEQEAELKKNATYHDNTDFWAFSTYLMQREEFKPQLARLMAYYKTDELLRKAFWDFNNDLMQEEFDAPDGLDTMGYFDMLVERRDIPVVKIDNTSVHKQEEQANQPPSGDYREPSRSKDQGSDALPPVDFKGEKTEAELKCNEAIGKVDKLSTLLGHLPDDVPGLRQTKEDGQRICHFLQQTIQEVRETIKRAADER
jgi:ParB-like chromosome segregation protein Spo0J